MSARDVSANCHRMSVPGVEWLTQVANEHATLARLIERTWETSVWAAPCWSRGAVLGSECNARALHVFHLLINRLHFFEQLSVKRMSPWLAINNVPQAHTRAIQMSRVRVAPKDTSQRTTRSAHSWAQW